MEHQIQAIKIFLAVIFALACLLSVRPLHAREFADDFNDGQFALSVQQWDRAAQLFTEVIKKKSDFAPAYYSRALAYSKKGEYDKSIEDLKKVIQLHPESSDAYRLLGTVYEIKKDYASALKVYREVLPRIKDPAARRVVEGWIANLEAKSKQSK